MKYYSIAGLNVEMSFKGETLTEQAKAYELSEKPEKIDMTVVVDDDFLAEEQRRNPYTTINLCEYMWTGASFYEQLLDFDGFMLHSSAVVMDNGAYLFSAPSGTGKSTHTGLWLKVFGDRAKILNDDKPAIRKTENGIVACGTPWSGKTDLSINECVPLKGICFLERNEKNVIRKLGAAEALGLLLDQTIRPREMKNMDKLLVCLDNLLKNVNVWKMGCNMEDEAPLVSYRAMSGNEI